MAYAGRVKIVSFMGYIQVVFGANFLLVKYIGSVRRGYAL